MIVTKKGISFITKIRSLKTHGVLKTRYLHVYPGHNFRLTIYKQLLVALN